MIRIAVCDDEVIFVRCLRDMVEALFEKQGMEFQCFVYTNAPELIQAHRKEEFQLLFLDIDMPEMSGMELAAEIRAMNSAAALIFVSSHSDFVFESFQFQPFRFLRKLVEVVYFFSIRHHIYLVTLEETAELSAREYTLEKLEEQFSRSGFLRIHKSYLLNYRYVYHIGNDTVELTPHRLKKLPLSHRRSAAVRKRYQYFMRGEDDT